MANCWNSPGRISPPVNVTLLTASVTSPSSPSTGSSRRVVSVR
jgi:hypothetical protein